MLHFTFNLDKRRVLLSITFFFLMITLKFLEHWPKHDKNSLMSIVALQDFYLKDDLSKKFVGL